MFGSLCLCLSLTSESLWFYIALQCDDSNIYEIFSTSKVLINFVLQRGSPLSVIVNLTCRRDGSILIYTVY